MIARTRVRAISSAVLCCFAAMVAAAQQPNGHAAREAASSPASATAQQIEALVRQLADPAFARREAAQAELIRIGPAAIDALLKFVDSRDPEMTARIAKVFPVPADPLRRVEVAIRMLDTGRPEMIRCAIDLLFVDAEQTSKRFTEEARQAGGLVARMQPEISEALERWVGHMQLMQRQPASQQAKQQANTDDLRRSLRSQAFLFSIVAVSDHAASRPVTTHPDDEYERDE